MVERQSQGKKRSVLLTASPRPFRGVPIWFERGFRGLKPLVSKEFQRGLKTLHVFRRPEMSV